MKTIRLSWLIVATQLSILPTTLYAFENDPFFEMPVVLSASRLEQPISETPVAVTSIDRDLIEASGARTIPEVLRLVPGMIVGYSANEFGEEAKIVVAYHGHTDQFSRRMQVLIDGRSIYEPLLGGVAWNMLPINIDDIERIEVVRGPNASTYGSNSFLGVVNIITRHAAEDPGHFVKANIGNHDIRDLTYRFGGNNGDLDYRITMSTQNDDGQDARRNISTPTNPYRYSDEKVNNHDDANADAFDYRIDYQINNNNQLTYQGGYSKTLLDINENFGLNGLRPVRESDTINAHQFLKLETTHDSKNTFVIQYYYNLQDKTDRSISNPIDPSVFIPFPPTDIFTLDLDLGLKSERHNLEFTHFNQTTNDLRFIWGLSTQVDTAESPYLLGKDVSVQRKTHRLFANTEWQLNQSNIINLGLQIEHNQTTQTDSSPRISLIHKINDRHSLRFGLSKATRSPFIAEEYGNITLSQVITSGGVPIGTLVDIQLIPNHNIDQEKMISREIGYYGQFLGNRLTFNARLFKNTLEELVRLLSGNVVPTDDIGTAAQNVNDNDTTTKGIEIEFDFSVDKSLRLTGTASYLKISSDDNPRDGQSKVLEKSAPSYTASLLAIKQFNEHYSGSMGLYYVDDMSWLDANSRDSNNYSTLDLRLTKNILIGSDPAKISLVLKNLLNEYTNYDPNPDDGPLVEQNLTGYLELAMQFR